MSNIGSGEVIYPRTISPEPESHPFSFVIESTFQPRIVLVRCMIPHRNKRI